jgi:hypothetical protein
MATMMKTAPRELHDYISETSEHADVRPGSPLLLGTQEWGGQDLFAPGEEAILDNSKTFRVAARSSAILLARKQKPASEEGAK